MKIHSKYILQAAAALLFCAVVASCADDLKSNESQLQPGEYPLMLTAVVDEMAARSDGKDYWTDGDEIGVRIGDYPNVGCYMLNADGTVMSAVKSLDWHTIEPSTVTAWHPYLDLNETKTVSIADQSNGFAEYDFLTARAENQIYTKPVGLNFKHQMAKISCKLLQDEGISDKEWETVKVSIAGFTKASFSNGVLSGSNDDANKWITPVSEPKASDKGSCVYEALVVPQDMTGAEFIKINLTVNVNNNPIDKTLTYTAAAGEANLQAGTHYSYTVTVKKDRLEVSSISADWKDEGEPHTAAPAEFIVNLPKDVTLPEDMTFTENVTPYDNYLLVKGNRFTISYEVTDDNITKVFQIYTDNRESDRDIVNRTLTKNADDKFIYYFNYYLLSEKVDLKYVDFVQVGDYYYSNGTWGPLELKGNKTPIGIVFKVGAGGSGVFEDKEANYGWTEKEKKINGYAVALNDATDTKVSWGTSGTIGELYNSNNKALNESPYTGYNLTLVIKDKDFAAVKAALNYEPKAPGSSSGWYLPSIRQLVDIQNLPDRAELFNKVAGEDVKSGTEKDNLIYWSCLERTSSKANGYLFDVNANVSSTDRTKAVGYVRAVLTF